MKIYLKKTITETAESLCNLYNIEYKEAYVLAEKLHSDYAAFARYEESQRRNSYKQLSIIAKALGYR